MAEKKKLNTVVLVFLIVMTLVSFANLIRIEFDGSLLKLAGLVVIIGVVAFFVTRKTNDSKDEGLNIKTCLSQIKNRKIIILILIPVIFDVLTVFVVMVFE